MLLAAGLMSSRAQCLALITIREWLPTVSSGARTQSTPATIGEQCTTLDSRRCSSCTFGLAQRCRCSGASLPASCLHWQTDTDHRLTVALTASDRYCAVAPLSLATSAAVPACVSFGVHWAARIPLPPCQSHCWCLPSVLALSSPSSPTPTLTTLCLPPLPAPSTSY